MKVGIRSIVYCMRHKMHFNLVETKSRIEPRTIINCLRSQGIRFLHLATAIIVHPQAKRKPRNLSPISTSFAMNNCQTYSKTHIQFVKAVKTSLLQDIQFQLPQGITWSTSNLNFMRSTRGRSKICRDSFRNRRRSIKGRTSLYRAFLKWGGLWTVRKKIVPLKNFGDGLSIFPKESDLHNYFVH